MVQLRLILKRLRKPSVIASLTSQIMALLILFEVSVDTTLITSVITALTSIMVLLGIFSNPDNQHLGYRDDIVLCSKCNKLTQHVKVGNVMLCVNCGGSNESDTNANNSNANDTIANSSNTNHSIANSSSANHSIANSSSANHSIASISNDIITSTDPSSSPVTQ